MFSRTIFILLFGMIVVPVSAQPQFPTIGLITHEDILLQNCKTQLAKNQVTEMFITEDYSNTTFGRHMIDTTFYGFNKAGEVKYQLIQLFETWPPADSIKHKNDNGWRGYDTIDVSPCNALTYCTKLEADSYDSINQEGNRTAVYLSYNHKQTRIINLYNEKGWLVEQKVRNNWLDGSTTYRALYKYDKSGRIVEMQYWNIGKSKNGSTFQNIFDAFDFDLMYVKSFGYSKSGLLSSIKCTMRKSPKESFIPLFIASYSYKNELPVLVKFKYTDPTTAYAPIVMGYKFQ